MHQFCWQAFKHKNKKLARFNIHIFIHIDPLCDSFCATAANISNVNNIGIWYVNNFRVSNDIELA